MSRTTTQHSDRQQATKASPDSGVTLSLRMAMTMAEGRKRLQMKQAEAIHDAVSENALYYKNALSNMTSGSALFAAEWTALYQHKAERYSHLLHDYQKIAFESATEINRLVAESMSGLNPGAFINFVRGAALFPVFERRVASEVIPFPDRRSEATTAQMEERARNSGRRRVAP